ncbi:MAG TPA: hypothetical protein VIL50_01830 [Candidatus Limnocylindrales bacterium]
MLAKLDPGDAGERKRVLGLELQGSVEGRHCGRVQRRVGGLPDPLRESKPEVALRIFIGRVSADLRLKTGDFGHGR